MTHEDIYEKYMIEYDKANITSSYPSLTKYEIATLLDKAYLALIAQKLTGNNPRKVGFETDIKSIEDIRPLLITQQIASSRSTTKSSNDIQFDIPTTYLYYIQSQITIGTNPTRIDSYNHNANSVQLINHIAANNFKVSATNLPWIKEPVAYIENGKIYVLIDPIKYEPNTSGVLDLTYIKKPVKFVQQNNIFSKTRQFELSDSMAEELINLAIIMALETVESSRLTTKVQTSTYES